MTTEAVEESKTQSTGSQEEAKSADVDFMKELSADVPEYEAQFFGFTPQSFVDGIYNTLIEYLYDSLNVVEKYIIQEYKLESAESKIPPEQVRQGSQKIFAKMKGEIDKSFDKLEGYMISNIFHIPSHVILPEDKVQLDHAYTEDDEDKLDQELTELRQKIRNTKYMNKWMVENTKNMEQVQGKLDQLSSMLDDLDKAQKDAGVTDLKEAMVFNISRVKQIQDNVKKIMSNHFHSDAPDDNSDSNEETMKQMSKRVKLKQEMVM
ncbi:protein MIS12 homolog [Ptychodera flava]|uniref:protein MIS12 homolog n=1 Tax=Ptychodera flava TaxID=63121 RepID=UPI003969E57F